MSSEVDKLEGQNQTIEKFEIQKLIHESHLAQYRADREFNLEFLRTVVNYGQAALKSSILVNGGASAALLAFIGKIWGEHYSHEVVSSLTLAILLFVFGVLSGAIASGTAYITNYCYSERHNTTAVVFHVLTLILVIGSYILFGIGAYKSYLAFFAHLGSG